MGVSFKKIFSENEEELVVNRSRNAIKALIYMAIAVVCIIVIAVVIKYSGDKDAIRRDKIIQDIQAVKTAVENRAKDYKISPTTAELVGTSLKENPIVLTINGVEEEYRYGYYYVTPEELASLTQALNLKSEAYIVNYDTYDVINYKGIVYAKGRYHSYDDLLLIKNGKTPAKKQIIRTVEDLNNIRNNPSGHYKLSSNLDLSSYELGEGWRPISQFSGTLDGRGYTISNLTISRPSSRYVGLFENLTDTARVTNIKFENVSIRGGEYVGTLAGSNAGNINNVTISSGSVIGQTNYTGGLVGSHNNGIISSCVVLLDQINGNSAVGGVVGTLYSGTLTKSGAKTSITGRESVGGVIGMAAIDNATYVQQVCANTKITGTNSLGGLIGTLQILTDDRIELENSYGKGTINGTHKNAGGLVGMITSVGDANIYFNALYADVDILNKDVTSGGCVGYFDVSVTSNAIVKDCFWEKDLAPGEVLRDIGTKAANSITFSFDDKTPEDMRIRNTFVNWNFDIWGIDERVRTPYLRWEV